MREKDIEQYLVTRVKVAGGKAYKWISPGNAGVPDRIVFLPRGRIVFVELKATGKTPSPLQLSKHRELSKLGHIVYVLDSTEGVDRFLEELG